LDRDADRAAGIAIAADEGTMTAPAITAPVAKTVQFEQEIHGQRLSDPYRWLQDKDDPEVIAHLEAENAYTEAVMAHTAGLQETLYQEMVGRIQETDLSVPVRIDDFYYYSRTEEGRQYPIFCRKRGALEADEEIILDANEEAAGEAYFALGAFAVSPDHKTLAYATDTSGAETYNLVFKDLDSGAMLPDRIEQVATSLVWANDSRTVFYTKEDHAKRPERVHRHRLGESEDPMVFREPDELFRVRLFKTKDRAFVLLAIGSLETTEIRTLAADRPEADFAVVEPREPGHRYQVEHRDGRFYILTNDDAPNNKLVTVAADEPGMAGWTPFIEHDPGIKLDGLEMFERHLAIYERRGGLRSVRVIEHASGEAHEIAFEEPVYTFTGERNPRFESGTLRFVYTSLTTPRSIYDYDMTTRARTLLKRQPVLGDFDSANYESERLFVTAEDGAKVPISLVHRKGIELDGSNPCLLYGYGAYGISIDPTFSSHRLSLLDRGMIFAIAHIRGGQEMGRQWYDHGKFLQKKNSFTDFVAAGRALIEEGYTGSEKLAIMGGSAGGLLMGAVVNLAPDLARAVVAKVPFVDVINTMLDPSLPLTIQEYEEWGNPTDPEYFAYIKSYAPYENIEAKAYPSILATGGINDPRVHYWEPAKWVAKLRATRTDDHRLLLKTNMGAGHGGASGRYDALKELAFDYAFILDTLGVAEPPAA
jgi:oligopeptidase B